MPYWDERTSIGTGTNLPFSEWGDPRDRRPADRPPGPRSEPEGSLRQDELFLPFAMR
jgi:hypothetical protein